MGAVRKRESYHQFLQRVKMSLGIRAEMHRLQSGACSQPYGDHVDEGFDEIERGVERCEAAGHRCLQVCVENLTSSTASYTSTWKAILHWAGARHTQMSCFLKYDPHGHADARHTTAGLELERREAMHRIVRELDT